MVELNVWLEGFDMVDNIKIVLEVVCLGIVFCVDFFVFVVCDVVWLVGGKWFFVLLGCCDVIILVVFLVVKNLLDLLNFMDEFMKLFVNYGLIWDEMVIFFGVYMIGDMVCYFIDNR